MAKRYGGKEKRRLMSGWAESNESRASYARRHGISAGSLARWEAELGPAVEGGGVRFVEVELPASVPGWLGSSWVPGGRRLHGSKDPIIVAPGGAQVFLDLAGLLLDRRAEIAPMVATGAGSGLRQRPVDRTFRQRAPVRVVFDPSDASQTTAAEGWIDELAPFEVTVSRHPIPAPETLATIFRGPRSERGRDVIATLLKP
jgi:hypothetical protein